MRAQERRSAKWSIVTDEAAGRSCSRPISIVILDLILGFACNNVHASAGTEFRNCFGIFVSGLSHYSGTIETSPARPPCWPRYVHIIAFSGYTPRHPANEHLQPTLHCCSTMNSRRMDGGHCLHLCNSKLVTKFLYISTKPPDR